MNSSKVNPITRKGTHHSYGEFWLYPWCGDRRLAKKIARRAQRRDNHKEIKAQLAEVGSTFIVEEVDRSYMYAGVPPNQFSPIPEFAMTDWERGGMEYFRQLKSIYAILPRNKGVLGWKRIEAARKRHIDTDETLFETLQRSVNRS